MSSSWSACSAPMVDCRPAAGARALDCSGPARVASAGLLAAPEGVGAAALGEWRARVAAAARPAGRGISRDEWVRELRAAVSALERWRAARVGETRAWSEHDERSLRSVVVRLERAGRGCGSGGGSGGGDGDGGAWD